MSDDALIREQIEYYRQRAPEYDETSTPVGDALADFGNEVEAALNAFKPGGEVLEIASGTGTWTKLLLQHADSVTALDSSPEMRQESKRKLGGDPKVRYVEADVLAWEPDRPYDVVFFAAWLSHVPPAVFDAFWQTVKRALAPGGRVFFTDEIEDAWRNEEHLHEEFVHDSSVPVVRRPLLDGRTFNVVKMFWDPDELQNRLTGLGWAIKVHAVGPFYWGEGQLQRKPSASRAVGPPIIVPYNPDWPPRFEQEASRIRAALGNIAVRIEHVGSTAVPGLAAKDTIDIQISVPRMDRSLYEGCLESLGYTSVWDMATDEHHFFGRPYETRPRLFNVHVCPAGSEWERRHIAFRDYLRSNPEARQCYEAFKKEIAPNFDDTLEYADAKEDFIRQMEREAGLL